MRSTQLIRHVLVQIVASLNTSLFFQNRFFQCIVVDVYTMGTRKSSRSTKPPDDFVAESATPQQMSKAVKCELSQVESMIKDLTPTSFKAEQPTVNDRVFEDLRNQNLQLELDLTRTKLELLKLQRETTQPSAPNMATATTTTTPVRNPVTQPTLKNLQQDPVVQSELKSLMDSLGDPVLLGLTEEEQDPAQQLLEPSTSRGKRPLLIPDFISSLPLVLQEDKETVLGTSGDARIVLKTAQDKKLSLDKISFPQWSAANFRIMHSLMKGGSLSSTQDILEYIMYSSKISELAKCYPLPKVMQYDDLYHRMQFLTNCKWGTDSQFISHQTLHRPDPLTPTPTCHLLAKRPDQSSTQQQESKFATITNGVKVAALPLPVNMIMFASNRNAWEPTHNGSTSLLLLKTPNTEPTLNCRVFSAWYFDYRSSRRCLDHIVKCRD